MADLHWMKFWPDNYLGGTGHLTLAEHGAYIKLLCFAWDDSTCSIPADSEWIKRRLGVDDDEFARTVRPVIQEFWTEQAERLFQKRQRKEFFAAKASAERRGKSARKAAEARWGVDPLKGNGFPHA